MKSRGVAQRILGNYTQSIEALTTSLVVLKERESPEAINSMVNIALCYLKLGQDSIENFGSNNVGQECGLSRFAHQVQIDE